ncbi:hypothetical protein CN993_25025 [Bacillus thuringiensis]|uniref:endonuclease n=1 Tax=Bacillus thuringiensis TaxID=1428 RepID=UPI000BFDF0F0|nr:endonuclease [Bacillus thuringiensis]PGP40640.1 hypothetical protein CN993_25025 [Bacillus thuringiensis]
MKQEQFIELAGGVFKNDEYYNNWGGQDKYDNFWAFFDSEYKSVKSIYDGITISELRQKRLHSIEHIFPKGDIKAYLQRKGSVPENIIKGSTTNPLNFAAAHRDVNSFRGSLPFDIENDEIRYRLRLDSPGFYTDWGRDHEREWVVPNISRGNVARTMLYMALAYDVKILPEHLNTYRYWSKSDLPERWEVEYNEWVFEKHNIRNPFAIYDVEKMVQLLNDEELYLNILIGIE